MIYTPKTAISTPFLLISHALSACFSQRDACIQQRSGFRVSQTQPFFTEHWIKVKTRKETEEHYSPPGLGMMGVPGGPPPPGGP